MTDQLDRLATALAGRYQIHRELGAGGMATVYLADDLKHRREVAIKVLRPELGVVLGSERFRREIEIAGQLTHPHIVPLFDSGSADGFVYYVQPFIDGETLRQRLNREGPLPVDDTLAILREVVDALAKAHAQDVVHRDIKPENVMLSDGHALVTDFGIAKAVDDASEQDHLTQAGTAVGTPAYMAPEQAAADPAIDHRADLYAVGAIGYEMLVGQPPFPARSIRDALVAHVRHTAPPIGNARSDVPPTLQRLIRRCLEKEAGDRYPEARALLADLDEAVKERTAGAVARPTPPRRGRFVLATVAAGAMIAAGAFLFSRSPEERDLDPDVIAVAPFDVLGSDLALWQEGFAELLSHNLDGAGRLRTVSPTVGFARWTGRADPAAATRFAHDLAAGLVVFGRVTAEGPDSVRVAATLMDAATGNVIRDAEVRGPEVRTANLADSVAALFLLDLSRLRSLGAARLNSLGSASPVAIREFLRGERQYRSFRMDSATIHYRRALEADPGFALAYGRLGMIAAWGEGGSTGTADSLRLTAGALNRGLSVRESLIVASDSLAAALSANWAPDSRHARYFAILRQALEWYPDDAQIVYRMGEARMHRGWAYGASEEATLNTFEEAARLDSAFALIYPHLMFLRYSVFGLEAGQEATRAYLSLGPSGTSAVEALTTLELVDQLTAGNRAFLDTASAFQLLGPVWMLGRASDSGEVGVEAARRLAQLDPDHRAAAGRPLPYRGHFREAREIFPLSSDAERWVWQVRAEMDFIEGREPLADIVDSPALEEVHPMLALVTWADQRDTTAIREFIRRRETRGVRVSWGAGPWRQFAIARAEALLALARGDSTDALRRFDRLDPYLCAGGCGLTPIVHGRLLMEAGRFDDAARVLEAFPSHLYGPIYPTEIIWRLTRARAREGAGNLPGAIADYARVADAWGRADPTLQPFVDQARQGLARLVSESPSEQP